MQNFTTHTQGPFTQAQGAQEISLGSRTHHPWREVCITVTDSNENSIDVGTGVLNAEALKIGADKYVPFAESLDLVAGDRSWKPFFCAVSHIRITPASLPANAQYFVTINTYEL